MKVGFLKPVSCSIFLGLATAIISTSPAFANEAETYISNEVVAGSMSAPFVTTANLRLRTRPCTNEGLIQTVIPTGRTVYVTDFRDGEWYAVVVDGVSGYMHSGFLVESNRTYETPVANEPMSAAEEATEPISNVTTLEVNTGPTWYVTTVEFTEPVSNVTTVEFIEPISNVAAIEVAEPSSHMTTLEEVNTGPAWYMTTVEITVPESNETDDEFTRPESNETNDEFTEPAWQVTNEDFSEPAWQVTNEDFTVPAWQVTNEDFSEPAWQETNEDFSEPAWQVTNEDFSEPIWQETNEDFSEPVWQETNEDFSEPAWSEMYEYSLEPASYVTTANLMFRSEPCVDGGYVQAVIPIGETVQVTDIHGEWFEVEFGGTAGYIHSSFLVDEYEWYEPEPEPVPARIEKIHWSEARNILPTWEPVTITDVRTGTTFQIISFSHGNHADVEPATSEDTATLLSIYGGAWSWSTRPVLVHVGDRTFAASINGMPHDVSPVHGNNFNGHICLYFYGSSRHTGSLAHDRDHHNSIWEAYRSGH